MFDIVSYILGKKSGEKTVNIESDSCTFSDDGEGNTTGVVIQNKEDIKAFNELGYHYSEEHSNDHQYVFIK